MITRDKDLYRWRRRFAWYPKRVGNGRIWLEWYSWRHFPRPATLEFGLVFYRLYESRLGTWRRREFMMPFGPSSYSWAVYVAPPAADVIPIRRPA